MLIAQPSQPPAAIASTDPAAVTPYCGGISEVDVRGGGLDDCSIRLLAFGERIVAADNGKCGATNVTFRGFYVRKKRVRSS